MGQIVPAAYAPEDIEYYECVENEVKIIRPLFNLEIEKFKGLKKNLAHINVRGSENEAFFNYGFSQDKSKILYITIKQRIPNAYSGTAWKRHIGETFNEQRSIFS